MAEPYCGRSCIECTDREALGCPGCREGAAGDCKAAVCCRDRGHIACSTCSKREDCGLLQECGGMPEQRRAKLEAEQKHKAAIARHVRILARWIRALFWVILPLTLFGITQLDRIRELVPEAYALGQILTPAFALLYGLILLRLTAREYGYCAAGLCRLVIAGACYFGLYYPGMADIRWMETGVLLVTLLMVFVGEYNEMGAHSAALEGVNGVLALRWKNLWKWFIGTMICAVIGAALTAVTALVGVVIMMAAMAVLLLLVLYKILLLYRTSDAFRRYEAGI